MLDLLKGHTARVAARNLKEHRQANKACNTPEEEVKVWYDSALKTVLARLGARGRRLWKQGKILIEFVDGEWVMKFTGYTHVSEWITNEARQVRPCGECEGCKEASVFSYACPDVCEKTKYLPKEIPNPNYDKHVVVGERCFPAQIIDYCGPVRHLDRSDKIVTPKHFKKIGPKQRMAK